MKTPAILGAALFAVSAAFGGSTLDYARSEALRLLGRVGLEPNVLVSEGKGGVPYALAIRTDAPAPLPPASTEAVKWDGYALAAGEGAWTISALTEKGVLNGLYDLAQRWGFAFVYPTEEGELAPAKLNDVGEGQAVINPRFRYRGLFASSKELGYSNEEWNKFLAKLRFNALCSHSDATRANGESWLKVLGFRLEAGGHGMSSCLPRDLYEKSPELFRMFQPEDFGGKRMKDSNFCVSNPKTRKIVKENFKKKLLDAAKGGTYALHAWADDLPGGGWCMCSRCRPLLNTDQSQLTMNVEAQAVRELGLPMRVPAIAYHDTMFPSQLIKPDPLCFYLFAPRERCYAHALNDPNCARNCIFKRALDAWAECYKGIDDAHTFEYYNDKILFRGHTPFLPDVILGDAEAYEEAGIESWMSLQVGGDLLGVDFNMLAHALVAWEDGFDAQSLVRRLSAMLAPSAPELWADYLKQRATAYERAWRICDLPYDVYLDYRWLPERGGQSGADLVENLTAGAGLLHKALDEFRRATTGVKGPGASLIGRELKRCAFEAVDLDAMALQQRGLNAICESWNGGGDAAIECALANLKAARAKLDEAVKLCEATFTDAYKGKGTFVGQYYPSFVKNWTGKEIENKIRVYSWKETPAIFTSEQEEGGVYEATFVGGDVKGAEFRWQVEVGTGAATKREWRTRPIENFVSGSGKIQTYVPTDSFVYYVNLILADGTRIKGVDRMPKARLSEIGDRLKKAKTVTEPLAYTNAVGNVLNYRWHAPAKLEAGKKYPLVVFLHGAGERGQENVRQMIHGVPQILDYSERKNEPVFLVAGQVSGAPHPDDPAGCKWVQVPWDGKTQPMPEKPSVAMAALIDLIGELKQNPAVDVSRIYVTGLSMGGYGTWDLVMRRPAWFAAAMPLCGGADDSKVACVKDLPIWVFHGAEDTTVLPHRATDAVAALKAAGSTKVKLTVYPGIGHDCWTPTYASDEILGWLFSQKK